jgi:tetratricopeptide (TPR) repeat protein
MHVYDTKDLERRFGISASTVRSLVRAGHVHPVRTAGRLTYSFQDLLVMRTAGALRAAKIPAHAINRTLQKIRSSLPPGSPLSGLSITAVGNRIAVREGQTLREPESGQYTLALDVIAERGDIRVIERRDSPPQAQPAADEHFAKALELEESDADAACAAYAACLAADPRHTEARLNLGRLLHLAGRLSEAEQVYRGAEETDPLLAFNLGVLLEDLGRESDAITAYREALGQDPAFADAHFNLARLYERAGDARNSLRHLLAYRRLMD